MFSPELSVTVSHANWMWRHRLNNPLADAFTAIVTGHRPHSLDVSHARVLSKYSLTAGLLGGEVYVAEITDMAKIVGCAIWFPPGRALYDSYLAFNYPSEDLD
jgi:hypothetical protein